MAHFAKLDDNNVVIDVNSVNNHELVNSKNTVDENGSVVVSLVESEDKGVAFLTSWSGGHTNWKQTSYNATFRGKFAGIGDTYDPVTNMFVSPVVESIPVVEALQEPTLTLQEVIDLTSMDLSSLTSSDIPALTSEQISGL